MQAGKIRWAVAKRGQRLSQLVALGPVFGVVDDEIIAAGERQRVVQRLRLGAGMKVRHHQDFDIAGKIERSRCRDLVSASAASRINMI